VIQRKQAIEILNSIICAFTETMCMQIKSKTACGGQATLLNENEAE
jgi:hypothetical protein